MHLSSILGLFISSSLYSFRHKPTSYTMKKNFLLKSTLLFTGLLLLSLGSRAQSNSLLWKVTHKGTAKPTYIFGTIHALPQSSHFFPHAVDNALRSSDKLVLEIDMDNAEELSTLPSLMVLQGKTIKDLMTQEQLQKVSQYLIDSLGIPFEQVAALKPFVFTSLLLPKIVGTAPASIEQQLLTVAKEMDKTVEGIEKVAEQVAAFDKLPLDQQVKQLMELVSDMKKAKEDYQQLLNAYINQQLDQILTLSEKENVNYPQFTQILINERNINWIPRLEKMIAAGGSFVAVGAGHLPGSNGVIELLKNKGYTVEPVMVR